jgi:putative nucleotidyltransferase with HDIG domain
MSAAAVTPRAGAPSRPPTDDGAFDPLPLLGALTALRRLTGMYPAGHPMITAKLAELENLVLPPLRQAEVLRIDIVLGSVHLDGVSCRPDRQVSERIVAELVDLGVHSIHIRRGVTRDELARTGEFLWRAKENLAGVEPVEAQLAQRGVRHVSLGTIVPLDTRWRGDEWPDAPRGPLDPAYAQALELAQQAFETVSAGRHLDAVTVREMVELLVQKVARSSAALAQILAVKQYENLTYCHSVNVAIISLLLGRRLGLADGVLSMLVEGALLHDIGKTRVPVEIVKKPGALDRHERKLIEAHTTFGAEILADTDGVCPLTPTVALEHHRRVKGTGYPDLGTVLPHPLAQIVSVADVYEAVTGARSYQKPSRPEQACTILARLAGESLNTAIVKAFVNTITFFPLGSLVRTTRGDRGVVVRTNSSDPLHPVLILLDAPGSTRHEIDTSVRDSSGSYVYHIVETLCPEDGELDLTTLLLPQDATLPA